MHPKFAINTFEVFADDADVNAELGGDRHVIIADILHHELNGSRKPLRRIEAMAALSSEVGQALAQKRVLDIECDRALMNAYQSQSDLQ